MRPRNFSYLFIVRLGVGGRGYDVDLVLCYAFDFAMTVVVKMVSFPSYHSFLIKRSCATAQGKQYPIVST
jgi:hypothetical protein